MSRQTSVLASEGEWLKTSLHERSQHLDGDKLAFGSHLTPSLHTTRHDHKATRR
ncbi:MAG: hypothetical protein ABI417_07245 [Coleofasciculaceae cyanobacterium]